MMSHDFVSKGVDTVPGCSGWCPLSPVMHLLLAPNHEKLIAACYPPSSILLSSGSDYRPNAHELSRLTYFASNRPGKLNKLGSDLEKRAKTHCKKASVGNVKARA
jgi:protein EFR3